MTSGGSPALPRRLSPRGGKLQSKHSVQTAYVEGYVVSIPWTYCQVQIPQALK